MEEIHSISDDGIFKCKIKVLVHGTYVVTKLCDDLSDIKAIKSVQRVDVL